MGHGQFYVPKREGLSMRVPDGILKRIGFIGEVANTDERGNVTGDLHATGFFVNVSSQRFPSLSFSYS